MDLFSLSEEKITLQIEFMCFLMQLAFLHSSILSLYGLASLAYSELSAFKMSRLYLPFAIKHFLWMYIFVEGCIR